MTRSTTTTPTSNASTPYRLHAILPAMHLRDPVRCGEAVFCTTDHLNQYALEAPTIAAAVRRLATQYCDDQRNPLGKLGVELLPEAAADALIRLGIPRWCRDAVALCFITRGASMNCHHQQAISVCNSDHFDALPIRLRDRGYVIQCPGRVGWSNTLDHYRPALPTHLGSPRDGAFQLDSFLLNAFDRATAMYSAGRQRRAMRQVFRAVAIAMHATRILPETESTYYDLGIRIINWVSAFETLVHPGVGRVGINDVLRLVGNVDWIDAPPRVQASRRRSAIQLGHKRFVVRNHGGRVTGRESAACHLYRRLYNLRNALAHGNRLVLREFAANPKKRDGGRIDEVAPLLFRGCILERLRQLAVIPRIPRQGRLTPDQFRTLVRQNVNASHFDEAMAKVVFGR